MMMKLLLVACLVNFGSAWFWSKEKTGLEWDGLRTTFGNPFSKDFFTKEPRTVTEAIEQNWEKIDGYACDEGLFRGERYAKDNDRSVTLLFDNNGYIAGIQTTLPAAQLPACGAVKNQSCDYPPPNQRNTIFQEEDGSFTLTAYFTDPESICSKGRTQAEFEEDGTGTVLFIQNGPNPETDYENIPLQQSNVPEPWVQGSCFPLMGMHYWYDVTEDMNCDNFKPVFLLYNSDGFLNGFGWATGSSMSSAHFEHPTFDVIGKFIKPVPLCLKNYPELSTMHIYLTKSNAKNYCLPFF